FGGEGKPDHVRKSRVFNYLGQILGGWPRSISHIRHNSPVSRVRHRPVILGERGGAMIATRPEKAFPPYRAKFRREPVPARQRFRRSFMTNGNGAPQEQAPPQLNVLAQYTKDLSFENPNAPSSLAPQQQQPAINIQINVSANNLAESEFEVTLSIEGKAENAGKVMFSFELAYAGVFRIVNVPKENLHPLVMIECPRLLFPFAREIIATSVRDGGFPPLMLDPVDFVGLYRQNMERQAAAQAASGAKPS